MRVVLSCDWFLKYSASQAAGLARAGAEVILLCRQHTLEFDGNRAERDRTLERPAAAGVVIHELPGRLWNPVVTPALLRTRRAIRQFRPDVIHVHDSVDPRLHMLLPDAPMVLSVHDPTSHPGQPLHRPAARRWFLQAAHRRWRELANVLLIHSEHLRDQVELRPGQRCAVIPHGLEVRAQPLTPPDVPTVGFFGRLEPYKGLEVLARAMPHVWQVRPDVLLNVAGSGSTPFPLRDPRVTFERGYVPESKLDEYFSTVSLAVLPYTHASQTGAGSLAIARGVPFVASRLGGLADLVLDGTYVFESGDDVGLARAILRHIDDDLATRRRVLAEVAAPCSWDAVADLSLELYGQLQTSR